MTAPKDWRSRWRGWANSRHVGWVVLGLSLLPRLFLLAARPVWYDEAFAALFSATGPMSMLTGTLTQQSGVAADVHPIFYYTLLWLWQLAFGASPLAIRSLSVILGLAVVAVGARLARELWGREAALLAGVLLAFSPFQVHYAQEARMYALLAALSLGAALAFWRAIHGAGRGAWIVFALLAAAAQYAHNLAFVFLVPLALSGLATRRWRTIAATAVSGMGAVFLYLPWLMRLPEQVARIEWAYWIDPPGPAEVVRTLLVYLGGLPLPDWGIPIVLAGGLLAVVIAGLATLRMLRARDRGAVAGAWAAWLSIGPIALMFAVSLWRPVYLDRALLAGGAMLLLWLAWSLCSPRLTALLRVTAWAGLTGSALIGLFGFYSYRGFPYAPFRDLDALLRSEPVAGEVILHSNKISALPAEFVGPVLEHLYVADPPRSASDTLAPATQQVLHLIAEPDAATATAGAPGVWFVVFEREIDDYRSEGFAEHPSLAWLDDHFRREGALSLGDLTVYHFVR